MRMGWGWDENGMEMVWGWDGMGCGQRWVRMRMG